MRKKYREIMLIVLKLSNVLINLNSIKYLIIKNSFQKDLIYKNIKLYSVNMNKNKIYEFNNDNFTTILIFYIFKL